MNKTCCFHISNIPILDSQIFLFQLCIFSSSDTHAFYYTHATYEWSANVMDTTWVSDDGII